MEVFQYVLQQQKKHLTPEDITNPALDLGLHEASYAYPLEMVAQLHQHLGRPEKSMCAPTLCQSKTIPDRTERYTKL